MEVTFVDYIPVSALATVSAHYLLDVVLHHAHERSVVVDLVDPVWELAVPDQRVASHLLAILRGKVCNGIGIAPVKLVAVGLSGIPLHSVLRRDGAEFRAADDVLLRIVVADGQ